MRRYVPSWDGWLLNNYHSVSWLMKWFRYRSFKITFNILSYILKVASSSSSWDKNSSYWQQYTTGSNQMQIVSDDPRFIFNCSFEKCHHCQLASWYHKFRYVSFDTWCRILSYIPKAVSSSSSRDKNSSNRQHVSRGSNQEQIISEDHCSIFRSSSETCHFSWLAGC